VKTALVSKKMPTAAAKGSLFNPAGSKSLIVFVVLGLAWILGFASRLFAVIRFESIIHEFDPW
jgi:dolichyl-diphosphooligosaccharide--protein glycosyltransferase